MVSDSKPKKRTSETKEDSKDPKKQRKEDTNEIKKKKGEVKDLKIKSKEDSKENKKTRKEKHGDVQFDSELSTLEDVLSQETDNENSDLSCENKDEQQIVISGEERMEQEIAEKDSIADRHLDGSASNEDDSVDIKVKRKKKRNQKVEDNKEEGRKVETQDLEKKSMHKRQKAQEKVRVPGEVEKVSPPSPVQKGLKLSAGERGRKSTDLPGEVSDVKALGWGLGINQTSVGYRCLKRLLLRMAKRKIQTGKLRSWMKLKKSPLITV